MDYKKILYRVAVVFVAFLIFLTFFSRTLLDLSIPRVSVAFIDRGSIHPEAQSTGIVTAANVERVFAPAGGRITQIVQQGDTTNIRTVLFTISNDLQTLQTGLEQAQHELRMNGLAIEQATSNRAEAQRRLALLQAQPLDLPNPPTLNLWEFDMQLDANATAAEAIENDIATLELLYAEGIIPRQDIVNREADLARLALAREEIMTRRDQAVANYENTLASHNESAAAGQRTRNEQILAQQNVITGHDFAMTGLGIDRERIQNRIANLQEQIEGGGVVHVQLEDNPNRVITAISPGIDIGSMVVEGMPVLTTTIRNNNFIIEAPFPQSIEFIRAGQEVSVQVGTNQLEGITTRIVPDGNRNIVHIDVFSNQLSGGELARVTIAAESTSHAHVIPLSALREDAQGNHIMFITPHERRFGSDYIVTQLQVEVIERDDRNAAISARSGELPEGPIIVNSDMPITIDERVRPVGSHDFAPSR